jgi:hypothetical protein
MPNDTKSQPKPFYADEVREEYSERLELMAISFFGGFFSLAFGIACEMSKADSPNSWQGPVAYLPDALVFAGIICFITTLTQLAKSLPLKLKHTEAIAAGRPQKPTAETVPNGTPSRK